VHVIAAMVWVGGVVVLSTLVAVVLKVRDMNAISAFQSRAVIAEQRAAARSNHAEATRQLTRWAWGTRLTLVLVAAATWDMVFRPGV